ALPRAHKPYNISVTPGLTRGLLPKRKGISESSDNTHVLQGTQRFRIGVRNDGKGARTVEEVAFYCFVFSFKEITTLRVLLQKSYRKQPVGESWIRGFRCVRIPRKSKFADLHTAHRRLPVGYNRVFPEGF